MKILAKLFVVSLIGVMLPTYVLAQKGAQQTTVKAEVVHPAQLSLPGQQVQDVLVTPKTTKSSGQKTPILQKGTSGQTYCIGGLPAGKAGLIKDISNLDLVKMIIKIMNKSEGQIEFIKDRPGHDRRYALDWTKAETELGYKPKHDLETYLKQTIDWFTKNHTWWQQIKSGKYQQYYKQQYG